MVSTIADVTDASEDQIEVEMSVVTMMASFLQIRRLGSGIVKVSYEITVPETEDGGDGGDGTATTTAAPIVPVITAERVQQKLRQVSKTGLQQKLVEKIQARKARNGLVNPFTVVVATKSTPRVIHPWATRRSTAVVTTAITTTSPGTTTLLPGLSKNEAADAHFLLTATFGPTRASLAEIGSMSSYEQWVKSQMALPVGSHRQYYRERVSPRMTTANHISGPRPRCSKGSRWWGFVFRRSDVGKTVRVANGQIRLDGVVVSDIDPSYTGNGVPPPITCTDVVPGNWARNSRLCEPYARINVVHQNCFQGTRADWDNNRYCQQTCFNGGSAYPGDDCSVGWPNLNFNGYVCEVREGVGEYVRFSTSSSCSFPYTAMLNPSYWFSNGAGFSTTLAFGVVLPGIIALEDSPTSCSLGDVVQTDTEASGRFYVHETRMELLKNDLEVQATTTLGSLCQSAPKTFLNEKDGCKIVPSSDGCSPLSMRRARFMLNASSIAKISSAARRQVFTLRGLRPTMSPCGQVSRWRRMNDSNAEQCTLTQLSETDQTQLREALSAAGQGWLREIEVACDRVPPGTVVDLGSGELFEHIHSDEYNVYDFTDAEGAANWTVQGDELFFPETDDVASYWDFGVGRWAARSGLVGTLGAGVHLEDLHPPFQLHELFDAFAGLQSKGAYSMVCGSPGEVANKPVTGHHMPFHMNENYIGDGVDYDYDGGPYKWMNIYGPLAKRNIMVNLGIYGQDQLRQRSAWALSQIVTVSTFDGPADLMTEMYVSFYDIFVRHAFGNYRNIMQEMTYSPIMANWLTYINNKAVDVDGLFPDENYAREIMQVFSIGLWKLNRDGTMIIGANGEPVRTYENWNILDFARVFTGLMERSKRGNIEDNGRTNNLLDPMQMRMGWHDVYPKPNLDMGYLGDGYPLCSDLPALSFLAAGAKFSFIGSSTNELDVLVLTQGSPLFAKLCNAASAPCSFAATVELASSLQCQGGECTAVDVTIVKVADGYYEYVPPACVHPFFWDSGRVSRYVRESSAWWVAPRWTRCVHPTAAKAAGPHCCAGCSNNPNGWIINQGLTCETAHATYSWLLPSRCKNNEHWTSQKYCEKTCSEIGQGYPGSDCSFGDYVYERACAYSGEKLSYDETERRCASRGLKVCADYVRSTDANCDYELDYLWTSEPCNVDLYVHIDGRVSIDKDHDYQDMAKKAEFPVIWKDGFPAQNATGHCPTGCTASGTSCQCPATAAIYRAYETLPSRTDILMNLKIGAFPPAAPCILNCGGEVKAYSASGNIDNETIFEYDGRFYKNIHHKVHITGFEFRNPPTFTLKYDTQNKKATDEIEALIDHLFHHENTPQFLAYRLIQRFTSSNPSPKYVYDVQQAFRTGFFNGTEYNGVYGDLAATFAAIVLHPEARLAGNTTGSLREPLVKIIHFMRSMEYKTWYGGEVQLRDMMSITGQWPYSSTDVFNFYHPNFHPEGFPDGMVGPEFQIWTMPNVMGYINAMSSTLAMGHGQCNGGMGWGRDPHARPHGCSGGRFLYSEPQAGNRDSTITELDLLLTGGRLGHHATSVLKHEYDKASANNKLEAVQYASFVTPAFATLGDSTMPTSPAPTPTPEPAPPARNYRALVMMYFQGGLDSFQMLVPTRGSLYNEYRTIREGIAFTSNQLLSISTTGQASSTFGIHPNLPFLRTIYNSGELAFISNIGSLVEPLDARKFRENGKRCNGLFSHIDQERAAHTLTCQTATPIYKGAGGRLADALADGSQGYRTEAFSMAGRSKWSLGYQTNPKIVSRSNGNVPLYYASKIVTVMDNITSMKYENVFCEEYRRQLKDAFRVNEELGTTLSTASLSTGFNAPDSLAQQFKQIARLISAHGSRNAERDIFYAQLGGFDHHQGVAAGLVDRLTIVNNAISAMVTELKAQGNFDKVTLVMHTDFGRTLAPNSNVGTDHGWAGHTFVIGGSVNGGKVYNQYPETLLRGHSMDVMHGRIIPKFPWENIMVPVAKWMGVEDSQTHGVFPNLVNFNMSQHILPRSTVFSN